MVLWFRDNLKKIIILINFIYNLLSNKPTKHQHHHVEGTTRSINKKVWTFFKRIILGVGNFSQKDRHPLPQKEFGWAMWVHGQIVFSSGMLIQDGADPWVGASSFEVGILSLESL